MSGTLYVVATPLGNLDDFSPRAIQTLKQVELIACEDTRRTAQLCARFQIETRRVSYHQHNEQVRTDEFLERLKTGESIAIVSDAGTPGIHDPGQVIIQAAWEAGFTVCPIPGANAAATLLSASGLSADRYFFDGFLPSRSGERRRKLRELRDLPVTVVAFETPHRLEAFLKDFQTIFGERLLVIGRELTKRHETILRGTAESIQQQLSFPIKGEITIAWEGAVADTSPQQSSSPEADALSAAWKSSLNEADQDRRRALKVLAKRLGISRSEAKRRLDEFGLHENH